MAQTGAASLLSDSDAFGFCRDVIYSFIIEIFVLWSANGVSTATLILWETGVLVVGEENKGEVNVEDDNERGDHEKDFERATWKDWALVEVGLALLLLIFISVVAFILRFFEFLISSHGCNPLLGEPAENVTECNTVNEDVLVHDHIDNGDEWLSEAESEEVELSCVCRVVKEIPDEWSESSDFEDSADDVAVGHLAQKVEEKSDTDEECTHLGSEAEAAAVSVLVEVLEALDALVLADFSSDFFHIRKYLTCNYKDSINAS